MDLRRSNRRAPTVPIGQLDYPSPGTSFDGPIVLSGWVAFGSEPTARVEAWLDESPLGRARLGLPRPDLGVVSAAPDAAVAGFELRASRDAHPELGPGQAALRVVATSLAGERCELEPVPVVLSHTPPPEPAPAARPSSLPARGERRGRRVLAFTNVLSQGGASLYLFDLLREARRQGRIDPTVLTAVDGPLRGELEELGVQVHVASPSSLESLVPYLDRVEELAAWAAPGDFELVLVNTTSGHTVTGAAVAARLGLPAVWTIHESFELSELWAGLGPDVRAHAEATLAAAALAIFEADGTREMYRGVLDDRRCETLPYGLDPKPIDRFRAEFEPAKARAEEGIPVDADLLLCVGTVEPRKAQIPLALAFEQVAERFPNAHLAFVGTDTRSPSLALTDRVEASPLLERFHLVPATDRVQRWFGMADLFVCASDVESLPRSVLEAMIWETPVLATDVFGLPELIDDGETGWLCDARDIAKLTAGLERALVSTAAERERIGSAARQLVTTRHALDDYARRVSDLLDGVAGGNRTGDRLSTIPPPPATDSSS
jgi:glycosyltransferase involved in cell wall biosynthesis